MLREGGRGTVWLCQEGTCCKEKENVMEMEMETVEKVQQ